MKSSSDAHVPDILDTISNLSNDEVFTPPDVANEVLDLLPPEVWKDSTLRFLDPASKTGIFLREAARRLMVGLEDEFPDEDVRRSHIFKNMLFGFPITELTGLVSRRSVYYSKDASGEHSIIRFDDEQGNIPFVRMEHTYSVDGKCTICGSPQEQLERGESRENYAYRFIHDKEVVNLKFDVIVGNPPYQLESAGHGAQATPIYQLFVEQAFRLKPRYVALITPSRWFAGGMGLDAFRKRMLDSKNFKYLVDFPDGSEVFPGTQIKGGVSYFLWDRDYEGPCEVKTVQGGAEGTKSHRYLGEHGDIFIRFNDALPILEKVQKKQLGTIEEWISATNPFGLATNFKGYTDTSEKLDDIPLYTSSGVKYLSRRELPQGAEHLGKWKVFTPKAGPGNDGYPHKILGDPIVAPEDAACTMTYLVGGKFEDQRSAENYAALLQTRFIRFLVALRKNTQHVTRNSFKFVPQMDLNRRWTDEELYSFFEITEDEQIFIASIVREISSDEADTQS